MNRLSQQVAGPPIHALFIFLEPTNLILKLTDNTTQEKRTVDVDNVGIIRQIGQSGTHLLFRKPIKFGAEIRSLPQISL